MANVVFLSTQLINAQLINFASRKVRTCSYHMYPSRVIQAYCDLVTLRQDCHVVAGVTVRFCERTSISCDSSSFVSICYSKVK